MGEEDRSKGDHRLLGCLEKQRLCKRGSNIGPTSTILFCFVFKIRINGRNEFVRKCLHDVDEKDIRIPASALQFTRSRTYIVSNEYYRMK